MRARSRIRIAGALALLVLVATAATLASGAQTARPARAALVLKSRSPAMVGGTGFRPDRRVRVTLFEGQTFVRWPRTSGQGTFTTSFPAVIDRCSAWSITASQPGRRSVVLRGAKPECAPASTP
jgi:hypothetical protein